MACSETRLCGSYLLVFQDQHWRPCDMLRTFQCTWPTGCIWQRRSFLTFRAAQFSHILEEPPATTETAYAEDPLAKITQAQKGRILQVASLHAMQSVFPSSIFSEAPTGSRCNGARRGINQSPHDFVCDGRNVECKGASILWHRTKRSWLAHWQHIKFRQAAGMIHHLVLAMHSPGRVDILLHDHAFGIARHGVRTNSQGYSVNVHAGRGLLCPNQACEKMLRKMTDSPGSCLQLQAWETCDSFVSGLICEESAKEGAKPAARWYRNIPLAGKSSSSRGRSLQKLAFEVDCMMHPHCVLEDTVRGSADWRRNSVRVEFKSSRLQWSGSQSSWFVSFHGVKFWLSTSGSPAFDELWLGLYSPLGLHIVKHVDGFVSTHGIRTHTDGHLVTVRGPRGEKDPMVALEVILDKFREKGCELLAIITW